MKIAIEARAMSHPQWGGFKSYTTNLIRQLLPIDSNTSYQLYVDRPLQSDEFSGFENCHAHILKRVGGVANVPIREQIILPHALKQKSFDLLHLPAATGPIFPSVPTVITLHDIIEFKSKIDLRHTSLTTALSNYYTKFSIMRLLKKVSGILTVSHFSKNDIVDFFDIPSEKVCVTPIACADEFKPVNDSKPLADLKARYNLPEQFIFAIGSSSPRKNVSGLLDAYAALPADLKESQPLVILWTHKAIENNIQDKINAYGLDPLVHFVHQISTRDLALLYNAATAFVFPSTYEGFGLPALEAMSCGRPVIASNAASIPEVTGDGAALFDVTDQEAFTQTLFTVLTQADYRETLCHLGLKQAQKYSWENTAKKTYAYYKKVVEMKRKLPKS